MRIFKTQIEWKVIVPYPMVSIVISLYQLIIEGVHPNRRILAFEDPPSFANLNQWFLTGIHIDPRGL